MALLGTSGPLSALAQGLATEEPVSTGVQRTPRSFGSGPRAVALLLPPGDGVFARAAESLLAGFFAAHARDGAGLRVEVVEVDDQPDALAGVYAQLRDQGIERVVGPITRSGASALYEVGEVSIPTLALNFPDRELPAPTGVVFFGLGIEAESKQAAELAFGNALKRAGSRVPRAAVVGVATPVARRSALAFRDAWVALGGQCREPIEFAGPRPPRDLRQQLGAPLPHAVFLSMGPEDARAMRASLGTSVAVWGNSLISAGGPSTPLRIPELDGLRLIEMPWSIEPDNPVVNAYAKAPPGFNLEMTRLYALGIDGFRILRQLLDGPGAFELDGVTGRLIYTPSGESRVDRIALPAEYRNGVAVPVEGS